MAIYDNGTASLAANGQVTGIGTQWTMPLTLIRVGATLVFKTEPVQIYTISEITSDTSLSVYNPNGETVPAGTGYAILAHDGISVQGLAQDVAETLRYYQSRESEVATAVDVFKDFDGNAFQANVNQVNIQSQQVANDAAQVASDKSKVSADASSALASANSARSSLESTIEYANSVSGYVVVSFENGGTIEGKYQQAVFSADGDFEYFLWTGSFPKIVQPGSSPYSESGWLRVSSTKAFVFNSVSELRSSSNIDPSKPIILKGYYSYSSNGGGDLYVDSSDRSSSDNGGRIFVNASGQRIKRVGIFDTCRWVEFGIFPGMPDAELTKERCESALSYGLSQGVKYYETITKGSLTFNFPIAINIPANWASGDLYIKATGLHKFAYDFTEGAQDDVFSSTFSITSLGSNVSCHVEYSFDNIGMGRFPNKNIRYTALRCEGLVGSSFKVNGANNFGYALFLARCHNSCVTGNFYNCDGQLTTYSPGGAWDSFGDAVYIASRNVTVKDSRIVTTNGGRAGVVYEGTSIEFTGGSVIDCYIEGYDRGVHVESMSNRMDSVNIIGCRIYNCNTSVLAYHGSNSLYASDLEVNVNGLVSRCELSVSERANPTGFTAGHIMSAGANCTVNTNGCSFQQHVLGGISVIGNGKLNSMNDRLFVNSSPGGVPNIHLPYTRGTSIVNLDAETAKNGIVSNGDLFISNFRYGGDITISSGGKSVIRDFSMTLTGGYPNCGRIYLTGTATSTIIENGLFNRPIEYAIDNTQTRQLPETPIINNIRVNTTQESTARLLKNAESGANNRYRRSIPSYIADGVSFTTIT